MEILEETTMPDGTEIELELLRGEYVIGVYPVAKNTGKYGWVRGGRRFRLTIAENRYRNYSAENLKEDFESLKAGTKTLEDLSEYFWNGKKDMWYLGMIEKENSEW